MGWLDNLRSNARARAVRADSADEDAEHDARRLIDAGHAEEGRGRFDAALERYDDAARRAPSLASAPLNRGNALIALGRLDDALGAYAHAITIDPHYAAAHFNHGNALLALGRLEAAAESYRTAIRLSPDFVDAEVALGNILEEQGDLDGAAACFRRAIELRPGHAEVHGNLGHVLRKQGRLDDAHACYERALAIDADSTAAHYGLAAILRERGQQEGALAHYRQFLGAQPDHVEVLTHVGDLLCALERKVEAIATYRRAVEVDPRAVVAYNNMGNAHLALGEPELAAESFRAALAVDAERAEIMVNLGGTLVALKRIDEALPILREAVARLPNVAMAYFHLGTALYCRREYREAIERYHQAIALDPQYADAYCNLGSAHNDIGEHAEAMQAFRRAIELAPDHAHARSSLLFACSYDAAFDNAQMLAEAKSYGEVAARIAPAYTSWSNSPNPHRRLRVGVVSSDLRAHAAGYFAECAITALAADAAAQIDLYGYYTRSVADAITERIKAACRGWCDAGSLSSEDLAVRIRAEGIDVLIDLSGHTEGNRLLAFARKPAPVQATWLGYWATTGVAAIDYLIADPWTLPKGEERYFTERIWRLPETRLCFTAPIERIEVGPLPASANRCITFGSLNRLAKINDDVVALWSEVLRAVPGSRLLLKAGELRATDHEGLRSRFARHGVAGARLTFEGRSARAEYLATYRRVDIALDPFPFPGGATSAEALWMGVPVLTLAGDRFISRQGVSLLMNAGLPEWIAATPDDYVARAISHAADRERLASLRSGLRQQVLASPLFDAPRFARHLAAALRGMWTEWCEQRTSASAPAPRQP